MAVISFAKKPSAPEPTTAVAVVPKQEVQAASMLSSSEWEGEFTSRDVLLPYLSLGQKSGTLCDDHPEWVGKWIYDKAILLGETIRVIFCRTHKYYEEDLEYGSEDIPRRYDKIEEARAEGVEVRDVANLDLLIEVDAEKGSEFETFQFEGKSYLAARYTVRKSAYGATVKILRKDAGTWLKGSTKNGFYTMKASKAVNKGNTYYVPMLRADGKVSPELLVEIEQRFSS